MQLHLLKGFKQLQFLFKWVSFVFFISMVPLAYSGTVSPYLPINVSPLLENEVNRLATVSGMTSLSKPYSVARILAAMEKIKGSHPKLYARLKKGLKPYTQTYGITQLSAASSVSKDTHTVANQRGKYTNSHINVSLRSQAKVTNWLGVLVGGEYTHYREGDKNTEFQATGSMIALGTDWAQIDIGYKDIWLSPFKGSAQLLSTQAQTLPSISISNNLTLDIYGVKWNYHLFLAQMSRQQVQFKPGEFSNRKKPLLAGMHINFEITDWWTIGASRAFQFAGGERPVSAKTLAKAFFDPRGTDNDASVEEESGNQLAAISSKINFDGNIPFSFMVELAGEDTSNNKEYQLGNTALTAGLYFPYLLNNNASFNYEYSSWQTAWYSNNVYQEGYVNEGFVLGHWAMQPQRTLRTATPGSAHFVEMYWQIDDDKVISSSLKTSSLENTGSIKYNNAWELTLNYSKPWNNHILTTGIYLGKDSFGEKFTQFNVSWEL